MDHDLSRDLLELKAQFDTWRRTHRSPRAKTPGNLLQAALAICDRYPARLICRVCRISSKTFSRAAASTSSPKKRQSNDLFFKIRRCVDMATLRLLSLYMPHLVDDLFGLFV